MVSANIFVYGRRFCRVRIYIGLFEVMLRVYQDSGNGKVLR